MARGRGSDDEEMDDLDEELLMLTEKKSNKRNKSTESSDEDYEEKSTNKRKKTGSTPGRKKGSTSLQSSSISYSRGGRNRGAPIEQNDDDFYDDYDEDLYKDDDDRIELSKLPEVEREQILAGRYEKRKEARERWQREKLKEKEKKSSGTSSNTATSSDKYKISSSTRSRGDNKDDNKKEALKDIQRKREKSKKDKEDESYELAVESSQQSSGGTASTTSPISSASQRLKQKQDQERERNIREKEREMDKDIQKSIDTLTIHLMNHCRLSRNMLVKWVDQPYFETLAPGFFVRVVIGSHLNSPIYRIAEIVEVRRGHKLYKVENKETDKLLLLSYAGSCKEFGIENVSNNVITQAEHEKWISDMIRSEKKLPTPESIEKKIGDIKKAQEYIYTNEDIEKRAQERMKYQKTPHNIAFEKAKLIALRETLDVDSTEYKTTVERIEELNKLATEQKEESMTETEKLVSLINKKNKSLNFQYSQSAGTSTQEIVSNEFDPFARRKTRSNAVVAAEADLENNPNASTLSAALSPKESTPTKQSQSTPASTPAKSNYLKDEQSTKSLVNIHKSIDLNITIPDTSNKVLQVNPMKKKRPIIPANIIKSDNSKYKNILSFDEYLNKRQIK
ncbi:hypothetical protein DICPUDRAFT_156220 [Dictyostelium purpureum]|uniref:Plus3 domain-containing protein n=1 Tax=Dictyostelium purpureum TaxID=5786 RepID=F0ZW11_DICPU|nr:uncharacterized protein DICPUDRAFT_156220 [Dictyostelium purpureum]EGC31866.1 hypothetical protein DICPUDRAFT_156220 [Dictyostelium purpureum]|eukprot:XP_003291600.1 hypothetical protein DICPUDRAFT_156220 [Dictyostelium purpureum]